MQQINFALLLLTIPSFTLAESLTIPADSEFQIEPSQQILHLESLTIGNNAKITFAEDVTSWSLNVDRAAIGDNVLIDGGGMDGKTGEDGATYLEVKPNCGDGRDGGNGIDGEDGKAGRNLTLNMGIAELGGLRIDASGGSGGDGGKGGRGEPAGSGKTCLRADGGDGGNSGNGGDGGNGGQLRLSLWSVNPDRDINRYLQRIDAVADFGIGGAAGKLGEAGAGSPSQYSNIPSITGGRRRTHAGNDGADGTAGVAGARGVNGTVSITTAVNDSPANVHSSSSNENSDKKESANSNNGSTNTAREREIEQLRQQMEALQQRLEQLEQQ